MCGCVYSYNLSLYGGDPEVHQREKGPPVCGRPRVCPGEQQGGSRNPQESRSTTQLSCQMWRMLHHSVPLQTLGATCGPALTSAPSTVLFSWLKRRFLRKNPGTFFLPASITLAYIPSQNVLN